MKSSTKNASIKYPKDYFLDNDKTSAILVPITGEKQIDGEPLIDLGS